MRSMQHILAALLALPLFCGAQNLSMNLSPLVAEPGELISLNLMIDAPVSDLRGYTLDLYYDPDQVSLFSISEGEVLLSHPPTFLYWEDFNEGGTRRIHVDHAILGGTTGGTGPGNLLYVFFLAENCGIETITVDNVELRDLQNSPLPITVGPGFEHQICQAPMLEIDYLGASSAQLRWNRVLNANFFNVYRGPETDGPWTIVATTTDTSWVDTPIPAADSRRFYYVLADHD